MRDLVLFHAALADENRLRLLHLIKDGEICVCYLQGALRTNQPKVSRHLAYLRKAGLVETRRDGKWTHYRLKELSAEKKKILITTLAGLEREPVIRQDRARVKQITCCPTKYGVPALNPAGGR